MSTRLSDGIVGQLESAARAYEQAREELAKASQQLAKQRGRLDSAVEAYYEAITGELRGLSLKTDS